MGVLYDYFRAPGDEAAVALVRAPGHALGDVLELKGVDCEIVVGQLVAFALGVEWDQGIMRTRQVDPPEGSTDVSFDGPWTLAIGDSARDVLAAVADAELPGLGERWSEIEELDGALDASEAAELAAEIVGLARRAVAAGDRLYYWLCL